MTEAEKRREKEKARKKQEAKHKKDELAAASSGVRLCTQRTSLTKQQGEMRRRQMWAQAWPSVSTLACA